jgi:hypothetical protein
VRRLELADPLGAFEPLRQEMDERGIDIVDAVAQLLQFRFDGRHGLFLVPRSTFIGKARFDSNSGTIKHRFLELWRP